MPRPEVEPVDYLTKRGRRIFKLIVDHCKDNDLYADIDILDLTMLANSIDLYEAAAERVNQMRDSEDPKEREKAFGSGGKPSNDYMVMLKEYEKIMKHAPKYGLNPGDRAKIFGGLKKKKKADPNAGLDDEPVMRKAQ